MTPRRIRISTLAIHQIERASAWWHKHRDKAPHAFEEDLAEAFRLIRHNPTIGKPVAARPGMRRVQLERVRYYVYYKARPDNDIIDIVAVWHFSRRPPKL